MKGYILLLVNFMVIGVRAQSGHRMTRPDYFEAYHEMAISEMHRSGVPASITLAQGALESGDGNSSLAREDNNHFGIKCHEDWTGKRSFQDDDSKSECFRKYRSVEDSYRDHSDYLKAKSRYAFLFELSISDYKGWAKGLKKAGYATNPAYSESLIRIIEEFGLTKYDGMEVAQHALHKKTKHSNENSMTRATGETNRVKYIKAGAGDTYESLAAELGKMEWELPRYNDAKITDSIRPGQIIYVQPKRNRAQAGKKAYILKPGETMLSVSQLFAVKLDKLYALNLMSRNIQPKPGTTIQLRNTSNSRIRTKETVEKISGSNEDDEIRVEFNPQ